MVKEFQRIRYRVRSHENRKVWEKMFRSTFWALGGGPIVFGGMSGIDTALWDIKGKVLDVPLYQLLGGRPTKGYERTQAKYNSAGIKKK